MHLSYVIIGNGIAGVTAAEILRAEQAQCSLTMIADDPFPVYYRPALKDFLGGHLPEEKLWARPATFYEEHRIRFLPAHVTGIDPRQHCVQLHNGKTVRYHKLLLANGAHPRTLACRGRNLAGVFTLRTVADYQEIVQRLEDVARVVVCGSGTLALESAETLAQRGYEVTHLMRGDLFWSEILDPVASDMVLQEERRLGIDVRTHEEIAEIVGKDGEARGVVTTHGERIPCELVLIAIGIEPALDIIRPAGIACGRGVRVDSWMRTSVPDIYAAGDVVESSDTLTRRTRVVGQWFPAIQQAQIAALHMSGAGPSLPAAFGAPFYNATSLRGLDFVSIGLTHCPAAPGFLEIVAEPQARSYRKVILRDGCAVGALLLGDRRQALALKRAIDHRVNLAPVARQIFVEDFDLADWLSQQGVPAPLLSLESGHAPESAATVRQTSTALEAHASVAHLIPSSILRGLTNDPTLVLVGPDGAPKVFPLASGQRYVLGRGKQNDIALADASTSRRHAEVVSTTEGFFLRDLSSRYGVLLNGSKITTPTPLTHGDCAAIGNTLLYFSYPQARRPTPAPETARGGATAQNGRQAETTKQAALIAPERQTEPLDAARLRFEIEMCIGCNRCMDACPVPGSSLMDIATLNQATITETIPPEVARFSHECIMCGSCVPVCPVDNHRDLLMLSLKQRLGASWNNPPNMQHVVRVLPSDWTLPQLLQRLREQSFLSDSQEVPDTYLLHIIAASRTLILHPREVLLREGEYGRDLSLILEGRLELLATDRDESKLPVAILGRGEDVGGDGMLTGQPYKLSVRAQSPALLLQVPEQVMQRLMQLVPGVRQHFERFAQAHSLRAILKRMDLFRGVSEADLQTLIRQATIRQYERGERLFAEDRKGRPARETLHILLEGFVKVARLERAGGGSRGVHERVIAYRQGGDYFAGGLDLLGDGQPVTVTTINRCRVAEVNRRVVLALFRCYPDVEQRFALRMREYLEAAATARELLNSDEVWDAPAASSQTTGAHAQAGLHALVSSGVVEGTEVLVIDLDKCIHCNECENACERRHGHSRMNRKGLVIGNISIATACRQCQDPVCLLCSRAGIARRPNGEVYITESCIGCGICAERCPYGAISIAQIGEEPPSGDSWQRFSAWFTRGAGSERAKRTLPVISPAVAGGMRAASGPLDIFPPRGGYDELRKKIAIKCDLCAGYRDQACVQACPTGAALRVQPAHFFGSTEEILAPQSGKRRDADR